jgi:hypothetical protein
MSGIFISYRRADSDGWTGRLRDTLRARFGKRVFHDVDNIPDGEIFSDVIDRALQECEVALIIIGPNWATARDERGRRLDQEEDWVRTEAAMVLNRKIRVIPVLVGGAKLPRADELPEELRSITKRQAREIRSTSWDSDVGLLIDQLKQILGQRRRPAWLYALPAAAVVAVLAIFAGQRYFDSSTRPPDPVAVSKSGELPQQKPVPAATIAESVTSTPRESAKEKPPVIAKPEKAQPAPAPMKESAAPSQPAAPPASTTRPASKPASIPVAPAAPVSRQSAAVAVAPPVQEPRNPVAAQPEVAPPPDRVAAAAPAAPEKPARAPGLNIPSRPAAARELRVGDSWTYRLREVRFNKNLATVTHEISGGDASGIRESVRLGESVNQRRLPFEPRMFEQPIDRESKLIEFAPFLPAFLELQPGMTWGKIAGGSSPGADWRFSGKVAGRERVAVPAGSFDAVKAELEGHLDVTFPTTRDMASETFPAYQTYTVWFVPEVGRAVKYVRRTFNRARSLLDHEQYELMSYQLK